MHGDDIPTPPDRQSEWYYVDAGDVQGPVSWWALLRVLAAGEIPDDTLVWRSGMDDWARARLVQEIASFLPPEPPSPSDTPAGAEAPRPERSSASVVYEEPPAHPDPPTEQSGRAVLVLFVIVIAVIVGLLATKGNDRPSGDPARGSDRTEVDEELVLDGALASFPEPKQAIVRDFFERVERLIDNNASGLDLEALDSFGAGRKAGRAWALRGHRRLSDTALSRLLVLELERLENVGERLCGRILQGTADQTAEWRATAALDTADLRRFLDLRARALEAELRSDPPRRDMPSDDAVGDAYTAALRSMPRPDVDSLQRVFDADSISPAQECWATRTLYRHVSEIGAPHGSVLTRYLLWFGTDSDIS